MDGGDERRQGGRKRGHANMEVDAPAPMSHPQAADAAGPAAAAPAAPAQHAQQGEQQQARDPDAAFAATVDLIANTFGVPVDEAAAAWRAAAEPDAPWRALVGDHADWLAARAGLGPPVPAPPAGAMPAWLAMPPAPAAGAAPAWPAAPAGAAAVAAGGGAGAGEGGAVYYDPPEYRAQFPDYEGAMAGMREMKGLFRQLNGILQNLFEMDRERAAQAGAEAAAAAGAGGEVVGAEAEAAGNPGAAAWPGAAAGAAHESPSDCSTASRQVGQLVEDGEEVVQRLAQAAQPPPPQQQL